MLPSHPNPPPADPVVAALAQALFETATDALILADLTGAVVLDLNPAAERLAGVPRDELLAHPLARLLNTADTAALSALLAQTHTSGYGEAIEGFVSCRTGQGGWGRLPVTVTARRLGPATALLKLQPTETERLRADAELYRDLVETSHDLIWSVDLEGRWDFVNRAGVRAIYGCEPEDMLGRPFTDFESPEQARRDLEVFEQVKAGRSFFQYETVHRRADGSAVQLNFNAIARRDAAGNLLGTTGTATDVTQRRRAEQALRDAEHRFHAFMDRMPVVAFVKDSESRHLFLNQTFCATFGQPADTFLGKTDAELWTADVVERLRVHDRQVLEGGREVEFNERVPTPDGVVRDWWVVKFPFRDAQGRTLIGGVAIDLTERHQAQEALRRTEERYRLLFDRNFAGVFRTRIDNGRFLDCNDSFVRMLGFASRAEVLAHDALRLYANPADRAVLIRRLRNEPLVTHYEVRLRRRDGVVIWVLGNASLLRDPEEGEILEGTIIDISPRRRFEEALRESEAKYRTLVDNLDQAVFLLDDNLRFVAANPVFCQYLGQSEDALRGQAPFDVFPAEVAEQCRRASEAVLATGASSVIEERLTLGGRDHVFRVSRSPVRGEAGRVTGVLSIAWDVTEQLALEEQLRHVQKMEAVGQLAGGVAHDFNNLLTIVLGNLSYILSEHPAAEEAVQYLRDAEQAAHRAAELTRTLLGFARRNTLQTVPVAPAQSVGEVIRLARAAVGPDVALSAELPSDLWSVEADPGQLIQVLMNLTLNARDAMPEGGTVRFEAANVVPDSGYLAGHVEAQPGEYVRLRVRDTGTGMTEDVLRHLFEPFFTTKPKGKGTGLGLAMVFSIVKQHHGWIDVQSAPGRGTTFDVYWPRARSSARTAAGDQSTATAGTGTGTILVVDDEALIRQLARAVLTRAGYRVLLAKDGHEALDLYRAEQGAIDLVVLDGVMPGLSGRETLTELRRLDPRAQVLFSTSAEAEHLAVRDADLADGLLPKPYRADDLARAVREILERTRPGGGASR